MQDRPCLAHLYDILVSQRASPVIPRLPGEATDPEEGVEKSIKPSLPGPSCLRSEYLQGGWATRTGTDMMTHWNTALLIYLKGGDGVSYLVITAQVLQMCFAFSIERKFLKGRDVVPRRPPATAEPRNSGDPADVFHVLTEGVKGLEKKSQEEMVVLSPLQLSLPLHFLPCMPPPTNPPGTLDPETSFCLVSDSFRHPWNHLPPLPSTERGYS